MDKWLLCAFIFILESKGSHYTQDILYNINNLNDNNTLSINNFD